VAFDLSSLAGATPWGAAANALGGALTSSLPSAATAGPVVTGPKTVNIAGFGSKSNGTAQQSLTQPEPDRGEWFPSTPTLDGLPPWVLPAGGALLLLALVASIASRRR
jgi:hypothetical protein